MKENEMKVLLEEIIDTVLDHAEIRGIPDYSGNAGIAVVDYKELLKKLGELIKQ